MDYVDNASDTDDESRDSSSDSEASAADGSDNATTTFQSWIAAASRPKVIWSTAHLKSSPSPSPSPSLSPSPSPSPSPSDTSTQGSESTQGLKRKVNQDLKQENDQKRPRLPRIFLPIEKDQTVVKYTVFRARRPARHPLSDNRPAKIANSKEIVALPGARIVRVASFLDKHRANKRAAQLLRGLWTPSARRVDLDCSDKDPDRDGMFSGLIELATGAVVYIYVDRETVSFGEAGLTGHGSSSSEEDEEVEGSEAEEGAGSGITLRQDYAALLLRPRYDVFVFVRKPLDAKDGRYQITLYDEEDKGAETTGWASESGDSSSSSSESEAGDHGIRSKGRKNHRKQEAALPSSPDPRPCSPSPSPPPSLQPPSTHWVPHHEGSYTTLATAFRRVVDAFAEWTRPPEPPRLDAVFYYRDVLRPWIAETAQHPVVDEDDDGEDCDHPNSSSSVDVTAVEIQWTPVPQLRYAYEDIAATVVKSRLQGPLDLTGAFGRSVVEG